MDKDMSIKFNNVILFPKKKVDFEVDITLDEMHDIIMEKQKELDDLDVRMADILDQAIKIEKESQRLLDLAEKMQKGNEDF